MSIRRIVLIAALLIFPAALAVVATRGYIVRNAVVTAERRPPPSLWTPEIRTPTGLKATASWYREQGWLK